MKRIRIFVLSIVTIWLLSPINTFAQFMTTSQQDGFFRSSSNDYGNRSEQVYFQTNQKIGLDVYNEGNLTNQTFGAPVGSGLLIMLALGAGYGALKTRKKRDC